MPRIEIIYCQSWSYWLVKELAAILQKTLFATLLGLVLLSSVATAHAELVMTDDLGNRVELPSPPVRIVSLAPHLTEILYELGVADKIIATVAHSDYPEAAKQIPRLGDAFSLSMESIVSLSPDLILAWSTGGNSRTIARLRALGYPVFMNESGSLASIAQAIRQIGKMVDRVAIAEQKASEFEAALAEINSAPVLGTKVFFQIADTQLYTVNNKHLIGQAIAACGAINIFADVAVSVPLVSLESLVERQPDVIVVAMPVGGAVSQWAGTWEQLGWSSKVHTVDASLITRPGPRMILGVKSLCQAIQAGVRGNEQDSTSGHLLE